MGIVIISFSISAHEYLSIRYPSSVRLKHSVYYRSSRRCDAGIQRQCIHIAWRSGSIPHTYIPAVLPQASDGTTLWHLVCFVRLQEPSSCGIEHDGTTSAAFGISEFIPDVALWRVARFVSWVPACCHLLLGRDEQAR